MPVTIEQAVAEILRDGDPVRGIPGLNSLFGWDLYDGADPHIFVGESDPQPDESITVLREGGLPPFPGSNGSGPVGRRPVVTVATRSPLYANAQAIADRAQTILAEYQGEKSGTPIFRIDATAEAIPLGRDREDEGGRWIFSQPFQAVTKNYALAS